MRRAEGPHLTSFVHCRLAGHWEGRSKTKNSERQNRCNIFPRKVPLRLTKHFRPPSLTKEEQDERLLFALQVRTISREETPDSRFPFRSNRNTATTAEVKKSFLPVEFFNGEKDGFLPSQLWTQSLDAAPEHPLWSTILGRHRIRPGLFRPNFSARRIFQWRERGFYQVTASFYSILEALAGSMDLI